MMTITERLSPNFDQRQVLIDMLIFHYTDMPSTEDALARLCDFEAKVSAHYLIDERGRIYRLVEEEYRAWHAGKAYWAGASNINERSIGIELANPGHSHGYMPFPKIQMESLAVLTEGIIARHAIPKMRILGHSDIAPSRKMDPGELFDWKWLASQGIGFMPLAKASDYSEEEFIQALYSYGYDPHSPIGDVILAFCRHFRPSCLTTKMDKELADILCGLIDARGKVT